MISKVGIIDCEMFPSKINFDYQIIKDKIVSDQLTHLILPGVGSYNEAAKKIVKAIKSKPFLGICLRYPDQFRKWICLFICRFLPYKI